MPESDKPYVVCTLYPTVDKTNENLQDQLNHAHEIGLDLVAITLRDNFDLHSGAEIIDSRHISFIAVFKKHEKKEQKS